MRIAMVCGSCMRSSSPNHLTLVAVTDDGVVPFVCDNGHENRVILTESRFELLSEIAVHVIVDGYYRESVASFTASMERLFEHFVRTVFVTKGLEVDFERLWRQVRNQTERQLGIFAGLYLAETNALPELLPTEHVEFRNRVIHQGKIPTEQEAIRYGQAISAVVEPVMRILRNDPYKQAAFELYRQEFDAREKLAYPNGTSLVALQHIMTPFRLLDDGNPINIEERVARYARQRPHVLAATQPRTTPSVNPR